ncbi:MAG: 16S rRNA (cytosine(967)-C(5))-methyltransferase RsmB [Christensenellales bacterium]|jgi:16S rRNA (cytosine967-C5)-methyltransferase
MLDILIQSYRILFNIVLHGAYSSIELNKAANNKSVTKIVYGVLDNFVKYAYFISQLVNKPPKNKAKLILMIGIYCLKNMDSLPDYAVIDNAVELAKSVGLKENSGFINAVLKRAAHYEFTYPEDKNKYLSVYYSKPEFLVNYYIRRYGVERAEQILSVKPYEAEHIRYNALKISRKEFERKLIDSGTEFIKSKAEGYFIRVNDYAQRLYNEGIMTYQSLTSMLTVQALNICGTAKVSDLCAAPGGKSVYIAELYPGAKVIANDIHPHRAELIKSYIRRMDAENITVICSDATEYNPIFTDSDYVLVDAPCSGLGLVNKKPDIMLNINQDTIDKLSSLQYNILCKAGGYTKRGGVLMYSTCTTIEQENEGVVMKFLSEHKDFTLDSKFAPGAGGYMNFLPDGKGGDGYFIARMIRL